MGNPQFGVGLVVNSVLDRNLATGTGRSSLGALTAPASGPAVAWSCGPRPRRRVRLLGPRELASGRFPLELCRDAPRRNACIMAQARAVPGPGDWAGLGSLRLERH